MAPNDPTVRDRRGLLDEVLSNVFRDFIVEEEEEPVGSVTGPTQLPQDFPVVVALKDAAVNTLQQLLYLDEEDIKDLRLPKSYEKRLVRLLQWASSQDRSPADWRALTYDAVATHKPPPQYSGLAPSVLATGTTTGAAPSPQVVTPERPKTQDELTRALQRIDIKMFPVLTDDSQWVQFFEDFKDIADGFGYQEMFSADYVPPTPDDDPTSFEHFRSAERKMMQVLKLTLKTERSQNIYNQFREERAALKCIQALVKDYKNDYERQMLVTKLRKEIRAYRLDPKYSKSFDAFFIHYQTLLANYARLALPSEQLSDHDKREYLEDAVNGHPLIENMVRQTFITETSNQTRFSFNEFFEMVRIYAKHEDSKRGVLNSNAKEKKEVKVNTAESKERTSSGNRKKSGGGSVNYHGTGKGARGNGPGKKTGSSGSCATVKTIETPTDYTKNVPEDIWKKLTREQQVEFRENRFAYSKPARQNAPQNPVQQVNTGVISPSTENESAYAPRQGHAARQFMSGEQPQPEMIVTLNNQRYAYTLQRQINRAIFIRHLSNQVEGNERGATVDRGANGSLWGSIGRVLETTSNATIDVSGIDGKALSDLPIARCAAKLQSTKGPVIGIFENVAVKGDGTTIISSIQLEDFGAVVDEKSTLLGGNQSIRTSDSHEFPLQIINGLAQLPLEDFTDDEFQTLTHVQLTSPMPWDPAKYDSDKRDPALWNGTDDTTDKTEVAFSSHELNIFSAILETQPLVAAPQRSIVPKKPDYEALRPYFAWLPIEQIKETLAHSTQFCMAEARYPMRRHYKSRFPGANVKRLDEVLATDTIFSDIPALDDGIPGHAGCTMAQIFVGKTSHLIDVFPMKKKSDLPRTLEDFIRKHGAPLAMFSDGAKETMSNAMQEVYRKFYIRAHYKSEPYHQHQNAAERTIGYLKTLIQGLMDRTGTPADMWLLCLLYITTLLQHVSHDDLGGKSALQFVTGTVPDISPYLHFYWYEPVMYYDSSPEALTDTKTRAGRWCGPDWTTGDHLTYFILDDETRKVVSRSVLMSRNDPHIVNLRLPPFLPASTDGEPVIYTLPGDGEDIKTSDILDYSVDSERIKNGDLNPWHEPKTPKFTPEELIGKTFMHELPNGDKIKAEVVRKIDTFNAKNHEDIKILLKLGDEEAEDIIAYTKLSDIIEEQGGDLTTNFTKILEHAGPFTSQADHWMGSRFNVKLERANGDSIWMPLNKVAEIDPELCANYAVENNLSSREGWKFLNKFSRQRRNLRRLIRKARISQSESKYKFGVKVPVNWKEARSLQTAAGHSKWTDAEAVELKNLDDYSTFKDLGRNASAPEGYQRINVHFVYDVKHDMRHRARLVAGGHVTKETSDAYSSVVSLKSLRLALVIGELNGLTPMVGDIGNAYLEAHTREKVYFVAGPEFGDREGHTLLIDKALYGLRTSGARFHERLADALRDEGFKPSLCDPDLWLRDAGECYEYLCIWVDDIMAILKDPETFFDILQTKYKFKLKGVGHPEYHLGGDFGRDPDGTLYWSAKTYVKKILAMYERLYDGPPKKFSSPLDKDDHPELDKSKLLGDEDRKIYMSLVGALQWAITLGRFDISAAVASLSRFRAEPREDHLKRVKRICGYLRAHPDGAIRFRTGWPNNEALFGVMSKYDWQYSVYDDAKEDVLPFYPIPKGVTVRTTTWQDASLGQCKVTGKSLEGILLFVMQTPVEWHCKLQSTVETATFGSEFSVAKQATDMTISLRASLMAMGVPIEKSSWMLGDNKSVITQSTIPSSVLTKRHNALAYHRVRWAVAAGIINFVKVDGKENIADPLTKHMGYSEFMPLLKPILFWKGDTKAAFM